MLQMATCLFHKYPCMPVVEMFACELLSGYGWAIGYLGLTCWSHRLVKSVRLRLNEKPDTKSKMKIYRGRNSVLTSGLCTYTYTHRHTYTDKYKHIHTTAFINTPLIRQASLVDI